MGFVWLVLAGWRDETNRLPPQRPRPARPPSVRSSPHAGQRVVRRRPLPSPGRPHPRRRPQNTSRWHARWQAGGSEALHSAGPTGPDPLLSEQQLHLIDQALRQGARAHGFDTDHWTLARITTVIQRLTGVGYHRGHVWKLLRHRMGYRLQRPARRATERDERAIARWVAEDWP
jgi:transposase